MNIFLSPHNDDESLFGAFSIMRDNCYVIIITDSFIQTKRGDASCSADERWGETCRACDILGCPVLRLGLPDDTVTELDMENALARFVEFADKVYAPAIQGGNLHHDMVNRVAHKLFPGKILEYTTYTKSVLYTVGNKEIIPTPEELNKKHQALACYKSQLRINQPHFDAVFGMTEWLM